MIEWIWIGIFFSFYIPIRLWLFYRHNVGSLFNGFKRVKETKHE